MPISPLALRTAIRTRGWTRTLALRRLLAAGLVLLAAFLALRPSGSQDAPMLVAGRDLAAGTTLDEADVRLVRAPPPLLPRGVLTAVADVRGRVLAGPAADGEPITGARLVGAENTRLATGDPTAAAVAVRLADDGVADLLLPGSRVNVVGPDQEVLADNAVVLTVRTGDRDRAGNGGGLVLVGLPAPVATRVAAASLTKGVTVTLR